MNKKEVIFILKLLSERLFFPVHIRHRQLQQHHGWQRHDAALHRRSDHGRTEEGCGDLGYESGKELQQEAL